jgi:hypothetical protein
VPVSVEPHYGYLLQRFEVKSVNKIFRLSFIGLLLYFDESSDSQRALTINIFTVVDEIAVL